MAMAIFVVAFWLAALACAILSGRTLGVRPHADRISVWVAALGRKCHLLRPIPVLTYNPSVERIASDLRRLSAEMRQMPRGTSAARWYGVHMAYDYRLADACRALGLPEALGELGQGMDREMERLRIEAALERAGLLFRPATR